MTLKLDFQLPLPVVLRPTLRECPKSLPDIQTTLEISKNKPLNMHDKPMVTSHDGGRIAWAAALPPKCPLCVDLTAQVELT